MILSDPLGNIDPLSLATGEFGEMTFTEIRYFQPFHGGGDILLILF